jgi:hypothetical protein
MTTATATENKGFEWRILLGPTHGWQIPSTELGGSAQPRSPIERCELCGEAIGDGRPFMTNSVGEYPIHVNCPSSDEPVAIGVRPPRKTWLHFLEPSSFGRDPVGKSMLMRVRSDTFWRVF